MTMEVSSEIIKLEPEEEGESKVNLFFTQQYAIVNSDIKEEICYDSTNTYLHNKFESVTGYRKEEDNSSDCINSTKHEQNKNIENSTASDFKKHITKVRYRCKQCNFQTMWKSSLNRHYVQHGFSTICKCDQCNVSAHNTDINTEYKCDQCNFITKCTNILQSHDVDHTVVKAYKCNQCDFSANRKKIIKEHFKQHCPQRNLDPGHKCDHLCNYLLKRKSGLKGEYECDRCDFSTRHKWYLNRHYVKHSKLIFKCDECDFSSKYKSSLRDHCFEHQNTTYECYHCGYLTKRKRYLNEHFNLHCPYRNLIRKYKCDQCDYSSKWKSTLKTHYTKHNSSKLSKDYCEIRDTAFSCNECGYSTKWKSNLRAHIKLHYPQRSLNLKHKCDQCNYATNNKSHFNRHCLRHNLNLKYKCDQCDYSSKRINNLKTHLRKHHAKIMI